MIRTIITGSAGRMGKALVAAIAANPMAALSVVPCAISCAYHSISGTILASFFAAQDKK